jgi:hypothetical protein
MHFYASEVEFLHGFAWFWVAFFAGAIIYIHSANPMNPICYHGWRILKPILLTLSVVGIIVIFSNRDKD